MFGLRRQASVLASVRALREKLKTEEAASRRTALVERLEQRQLLSVTSANMATPDGSNQIYEGGATAALVLTGKTSSGTGTEWTIHFGDGTSLTNVIGPGDGTSTSTIYHAYASSDEEGQSHSVTAEVTEVSGSGSIYPVTTVLQVIDAPLTAYGLTVSLTSGVSFSGNMADFTDADPQGTASDYSASIDWGDGGSGSGTVVSDGGGGFFVQAQHAYSDQGIYGVVVTIYDAATQKVANAVANVVNPTISASVQNLTLWQDQDANVTLSIRDRNGNPLQGWLAKRMDGNQANVGDQLSSAPATDANGQTTVQLFGGKQPTQPGPAAAVTFAPQPAILPMPSNPNTVSINVTVQKVIWTFAGPTAQVISSTAGPTESDISLTATDVNGNPITAPLDVNFWEWGAEAWTAFDTASPLTFGNKKGEEIVGLVAIASPPQNVQATWWFVSESGDLSTSFTITVGP